MGAVYKKTSTRDLPAEAELFVRQGQQLAKWKDGKGKTRTAKVTTGRDGNLRIVTESATFYAKYRDGQGIVREVATGCRTKDGAQSILKGLTDRAAKVQGNILTAAEDGMIDHQHLRLATQFDCYLTDLELSGTSPVHRENVRRCLDRIATDCQFVTLASIDRDTIANWLRDQTGKGMGPRTRNIYRAAWVAFCNWEVKQKRLAANPLKDLPKTNDTTDQRRKRRSMAEAELRKLLYVARWRPLAEYGRQSIAGAKENTEGAGKRTNWTYAALSFDNLDAAVERARERLKDNPAFAAELESRGRERELIYKTLVLTGLRKGELASITVGQLQLNGELAFLELNAADEKNRQGSTIPLRADLTDDLRHWLADKQAACEDAARDTGTIKFESQPFQRQSAAQAKWRNDKGQLAHK